jgi:hypothetical protein
MRSSGRVVFALLALVAFSGSAWASCFGDAAVESQQMACCHAGHDQCPMHNTDSSCCTTSVARAQTQATLVKATGFPAPLSQTASFVADPVTVTSAPHHQFTVCSSPPIAAVHAPPYITFSALLI